MGLWVERHAGLCALHCHRHRHRGPAPTVWIGPSRATTGPDPAVEATSNITVTPATYNCGSSGGASETSPGPVANCTLAQGSISGSFTVPSGLNCTNVQRLRRQPNLSLTQSTYGADGGTGSSTRASPTTS